MIINEKKLKKILTDQRKEFQRYIGVLTKHFESQVKVVIEVLTDVQKQLIALREMVAKNTEDIEMMKIDIEMMKIELTKHSRDIETIKIDLNLIKNNLRQKVDREEFEALEKRVLLLEKSK